MNDDSETQISDTARRLVNHLRPHTPFAEAIVRRQTERAGISIATLSEADLPKVVPMILTAASTFVDPTVLARLKTRFDLP
ncbi:MAG: hypothetical protein ACRELY_06905 [Polyangiaceae bacterium]